MRLSQTATILIAGGLLLATLSACAQPPKPQPLPNLVPPAEEQPPPDIMKCAVTPENFPQGSNAELRIEVAKTLIEIAPVYGMMPGQINRLINWIAPGTCSD